MSVFIPHGRGPKPSNAVHCIDGQHCTLDDIAARLGTNRRAASRILGRVRRQPGPVTWAALLAYPTKKDVTP